MIVAEVLNKKGADVTKIVRDATIAEAVAVLAMHKIGALVVVDEADALVGIFTERDLVRMVHAEGAAVLQRPVAEAMTANPITCAKADKVSDVLATMSRFHFRHMPVSEAGAVVGILSIRDVILERLDHVENEAEAMRAYVSGL